MIPVIEVAPGAFSPLTGEDVISRDGERRTTASLLVSDAFSDEEREAFGVYLVAPAGPVPPGKVLVGVHFERIDGVVVQVLDLADAPVVVPRSVSPRQIRLAMHAAGVLPQVQAFVDSDACPREAKIAWEFATSFDRDDAMLNGLAEHLSPPMSQAQIDDLFHAAAAIA